MKLTLVFVLFTLCSTLVVAYEGDDSDLEALLDRNPLEPLEGLEAPPSLESEALSANKVTLKALLTKNALAGLMYPLYKQDDPRWGKQQLGRCVQSTIGSAGCAMCSVASMLSGRGKVINPGDLNQWLTKNGGYSNGCYMNWATSDKFGVAKYLVSLESAADANSHVNFQTAFSYNLTCTKLASGKSVIANVRNGRHFVLITGCLGKNIYAINDSGWPATTYKHADVVKFVIFRGNRTI